MRRFFTEPENIQGDVAHIIEDAGHIKNVLRMEKDEKIVVFDGSGIEYICTLDEIKNKECIAKIVERKTTESEPKTRVYIFQGIPKTGKMETIIQKSVELGVYKIVPVAMDRCVVRLDNKKAEGKVTRWNKVAVEAVKQCGRGLVPEVCMPVTFENAVEMMKNLDLGIMPYELLGHLGKHGLKGILKSVDCNSIGILIGPEGGFSDEEAEYAEGNKINTVGLGKRILRTETVASTILSVIMYEKDEI